MGSKRSRHNKGRKPRYKDHREHEALAFRAPVWDAPIVVTRGDLPAPLAVEACATQQTSEHDFGLTMHHIGDLEMLRRHPIAAIPAEVCNPRALVKLRQNDLIEQSGIPGFWVITDAGRSLNLDAAKPRERAQKWNDPIPHQPAPDAAATLLQVASEIDRLMPGQAVFGKSIRESTMEFLSGRSAFNKFVYLAYPEGFPLKHIAWAVRESGLRPNWGEQNVTVARAALGLPATRMKYKPAPTEQEISDNLLRKRLLDEGCEPWEIEEYFALRDDGRPVL